MRPTAFISVSVYGLRHAAELIKFTARNESDVTRPSVVQLTDFSTVHVAGPSMEDDKGKGEIVVALLEKPRSPVSPLLKLKCI